MQEALYVANSIPSRDGIQKSIVFISDGLPVGHNQEADYSEEDIIVEHIDDNNHKLSLKAELESSATYVYQQQQQEEDKNLDK